MERSSKKFLYIFYCNTQLWQNYGKNEFLGKNIFKTEKVRFFAGEGKACVARRSSRPLDASRLCVVACGDRTLCSGSL